MSTRSTRRSTRLRDQEPDSTDQIPQEVAQPAEPPVKRQKVVGQLDWQAMVSEDTLVQLARHPLDAVNIIEARFDDLSPVRSTWEYQYALTWINNVSESFVTAQIYPGGKAMWKTVDFDEVLLMKDLLALRDQASGDVSYAEPRDNEDDEDAQAALNMYDLVRLNLLRQLGNNKSIELEQWNELVNDFLGDNERLAALKFNEVHFYNVDVPQQFKIFYEIIKQIEAKNMVFRNFLANNMELFDFVKADYDTASDNQDGYATAVFLTTPYSVVERVQYAQDPDKKLLIPLKLQNCTVKYEDDDGQTELVHIDYSNEIDSYISNFHIKYNVLSYNFDTFMKSFQHFKDRLRKRDRVKSVVESFENTLEWMVLSKIDSAKRLIQREKRKSMRELMGRRKRSTRLIEKEEQVKQEGRDHELETKFDDREAFLKKRSRALARVVKRCKENLWNQLWLKYDQDVKNEKMKHRGELFSLIDGVTPEDPLSAVDKNILPNGVNYNARIIPTDVVTSPADDAAALRLEELPSNLCLSADDVKKAVELGVMHEAIDADNNDDWLFQCSCMSEKKESVKPEDSEAPVQEETPTPSHPVTIHNSDGEEINQAKYAKLDILDRPIVCCDQCHKWQHWQCQDGFLVELLSYAAVHSKKDLDNMKFLTQRDFATVQYEGQPTHLSSTRQRTSRRQHQEEEQEAKQASAMRPTDRRAPFGESAVFVCRMCLGRYETEQRATFKHELGLLRLKQKKQHDERERRKQRKQQEAQEKARAEAQARAQLQATAPTPVQAATYAPVQATTYTPAQPAAPAPVQTPTHTPVQPTMSQTTVPATLPTATAAAPPVAPVMATFTVQTPNTAAQTTPTGSSNPPSTTGPANSL